MQSTINNSGYIITQRKLSEQESVYEELNTVRFAYDFKNGDLVIHAFERIQDVDGKNIVIGKSYDNKTYLFYSKLPFNFPKFSMYPQNNHNEIDYVIKAYEYGSKYSEVYFDFDELQYFCPSGDVVNADEEDNVTFSGKSKVIKSFKIKLDGIDCDVSIVLGSKGKWGFAHSTMEAITELHISFPATNDFDFMNKLYLIVDSVFAFICNRRNTTCLSMKVKGIYPSVAMDNGKIVECNKHCTSEIFYFDKYREGPENERIISKTWNVSLFLKHIEELFVMVAEDICGNQNDGGNISIASVPPSVKRRNLIDLQQSLQISSAFEFYIRRYLPSMVEERDYHIIMKMILKEIENKSIGKLKQLAKNLGRNVVREPALEEKVMKVYSGYDKWPTLKMCISEEWYKSDEIKALGQEANRWRNELAHSKRSYEPSENTVRAIRLLEHMNYAIVLRKLGYHDDEIKEILEMALKR